MKGMLDLRTALLDLLHKLQGTEVSLIIGGGYGIYLKAEFVRPPRVRTLLEETPETRSTNDLDLFLRPELLIKSERLKPLRKALHDLGYEVIPGAEKYQFSKPGPAGNQTSGIKIDLLTGPRSSFQGTSVRTDNRRARPQPSVDIHAHPTDEALTLEKGLRLIILDGNLSSGDSFQAEIFLPHPYTFLLMKLFAFRDRFADPSKDYARYHALDLYTILATTTEDEWQSALHLLEQYKEHPRVREAGGMVAQYFSDSTGMGMLRLRESPYFRKELEIEKFMSALKELFPLDP